MWMLDSLTDYCYQKIHVSRARQKTEGESHWWTDLWKVSLPRLAHDFRIATTTTTTTLSTVWEQMAERGRELQATQSYIIPPWAIKYFTVVTFYSLSSNKTKFHSDRSRVPGFLLTTCNLSSVWKETRNRASVVNTRGLYYKKKKDV